MSVNVDALKRIFELESERDRLLLLAKTNADDMARLGRELDEAHVDCIRLQQEVNCLRMEPCQLPKCDRLRAQLKVCREALEKITKNKCECWKDSGPVNCSCGLEFQDIAKHALSQLEGK